MSLDVEGHEYQIMKNFPFDEYKFKAMTIELPCKNLDLLLDSKDYCKLHI